MSRAQSFASAMRRSGEEEPSEHAHLHRKQGQRGHDSRLLQVPEAILQDRGLQYDALCVRRLHVLHLS